MFTLSYYISDFDVSNTYMKIACRSSLENWLWKVYHVPQRYSKALLLIALRNLKLSELDR